MEKNRASSWKAKQGGASGIALKAGRKPSVTALHFCRGHGRPGFLLFPKTPGWKFMDPGFFGVGFPF